MTGSTNEIVVRVDRLLTTGEGTVVPLILSTRTYRLLSEAAQAVEDELVTEEPRQVSLIVGGAVLYGRIEQGRGLVWEAGAA